MSYKYKIALTGKSRPEGNKFYYSLKSARWARNKLGSAYYIYRHISGSYWKHIS